MLPFRLKKLAHPIVSRFLYGAAPTEPFIGKEGLSDGLLARLSELGFNNGVLTDAAFDGHWDALNFVCESSAVLETLKLRWTSGR